MPQPLLFISFKLLVETNRLLLNLLFSNDFVLDLLLFNLVLELCVFHVHLLDVRKTVFFVFSFNLFIIFLFFPFFSLLFELFIPFVIKQFPLLVKRSQMFFLVVDSQILLEFIVSPLEFGLCLDLPESLLVVLIQLVGSNLIDGFLRLKQSLIIYLITSGRREFCLALF